MSVGRREDSSRCFECLFVTLDSLARTLTGVHSRLEPRLAVRGTAAAGTSALASLLVVLIFGCRSRLLSDDTSDGLTSQVHVLFCPKLSFVCSESMLLFGEDHFYLFLSIFMLVVFLISADDFLRFILIK